MGTDRKTCCEDKAPTPASVSQCRVQTPCRSTACSHLNCFDAAAYLTMNEKKPTWTCPVCSQRATFDQLQIDTYMEQVCRDAPPDCREVELKANGSWQPTVENQRSRKRKEPHVEIIDLGLVRTPKSKRRARKEVIDLTAAE